MRRASICGGRAARLASCVRLASWLSGAVVAVLLAAAPLPAAAQSVSAGTDPGAEAALNATPAVVDGFRSAKFGMTQDDVLEAIEADFDLSGDAVVAGENRAERTRLLTVMVPELLPEGGTAQVSYVFGYTTGELIQVGVSWSQQTDPEMTAERLQANAEVLIGYFQSLNYDPASVRQGLLLENGVLLFRGEDAEGRSSILLMQGMFTDTEEGERVLTPVSLALLYAADSDNPDVFSIAPGQF